MRALAAILAALLASCTNAPRAVVECQRHTPPWNSANCTTAVTAHLDSGNVA